VFSGIRDLAFALLVNPVAISFIKKQTQAIKNVKNLKIDSRQKTFSLKLELSGEAEALSVAGRYRVVSENGKTAVAPSDIQTSKEWLTILAGELVKGRAFEVPGLIRSFL
jgi:hypothetical protein